MSQIIQFEQYQRLRCAPPLVFVDMLEDQLAGLAVHEAAPMLAKCRVLLDEARQRHWPVAFVRPPQLRPGHWIDGFEPHRSDMIFDRSGQSCYSSEEFAGAMDASGRVFVVAGFSTDGCCLATLIEASQNNHFAGLVEDATATRPLPGYDAAESHRAVMAVASRHGTIVTAEHWIGVATGTAQPQRSNVSRLR